MFKQEKNKVYDLSNVGSEIAELIKSVKTVTEKRQGIFTRLFEFTLDHDQWYSNELQEFKAKNQGYLTFNHSEDYFEEYLSRLFPRNPHTGTMEIGVSILDTDKELSNKYEQQILDNYHEQDLADTLLEQGQNFFIGGSACLFYPPDGFGGASIISINPKNVYLGWRGKNLIWVAIYDEDTKTYSFASDDLFVLLDNQFNVKKIDENKYKFIPFSWIPNMPKAHSREGRSKIEILFNLDREYNRQITNFSKRVDENTSPHRVVFSDQKPDEEKITRGKDKTTFLGKDDDMKHLELPEGKEFLEYIQKVEDKIKAKTALVDTSGAVKSATSGISLAFQYSGMLDRIAFFRVYWDKAFKELNRAILTYAFGPGNYKTSPVYNPAIFYDSVEKTKEVISQVDANLMSRADAIDILRGSSNNEEKLKEILEEKKAFPELDKKTNLDNSDNNFNN
jgi:hypothetical protein